MKNLTKLNRRRWAAQLALIRGLALLSLAALLGGLPGVAPVRADPGTLHVDGASGQDIPSCGTAIAPCQTISYTLSSRASDGDIILISAGTYPENLKIIQGNTLTIRGGYQVSDSGWMPAESGETVIDGNEIASTVLIRFGSNATFEKVTVTGGRGIDVPEFGSGCGGFLIQDGDVTIRNSRIVGNSAGDGMGGAICAAGDSREITLTIEDSVIADNDGVGGGGALNLYNTDAFLTNVLIYGNTAASNAVLQLYQAGSHVTFQNCTLSDNTPTGAAAMYIADPDTLTVRNSILWNNGQSISVGEGEHSCTDCVTVTYSDMDTGTGVYPGVGNINADPQFTDPSSGDYHLLPWSPCIDVGTATGAPDHDFEGDPRPQNAGFDMGADEFTGTPMPNEGPRYVATDGSDDANLCLDSAAPCRTIAHAVEMANADESVLVAQGTYTENLNIDGKTLTLRGGYAISGTEWLPGTGETIVDGNGADRTFLIQGNDSVLENLTITGGDTPDGQCWGGGVWVTNGDVTIRESLVTGNWADCSGAGVEVNSDFGPAHLTLVDSIVFDNHSGGDGGGVSVWHTGAHLTNTLIVSNTGSSGSALRIEDSDVTVQNCTIADNQGGVAINAYDTDAQSDVLTLRSSIAWGNTDGDLNCAVETCAVTYSDIGGGWASTGNIDADPQFVDAAGGDYHLGVGSPCIDNGTSAGAPAADVEGTPRDGAPDMGAYEWTGFRIFLPLTVKNFGP